VRGLALHGGDEIGNEISAPFELDVDVRPRVLGPDAERDESVVETDQCQNDDDKNNQKDDECHRLRERLRETWRRILVPG